jgi:hypothetical protein
MRNQLIIAAAASTLFVVSSAEAQTPAVGNSPPLVKTMLSPGSEG